MNRKLLTIVLTISLVAPIVLIYASLQHKLYTVRKEVKRNIIAGLDKEDLVLLKFTTKEAENELVWKHSKEFRYKDYMYDIVEKVTIGDTTYYWCWWDYQETFLSKKLQNLLSVALGTDHNKQNQDQQLAYFLKHLYVHNTTDTPKDFFTKRPEASFVKKLYKGLKTKPLPPPPNYSYFI